MPEYQKAPGSVENLLDRVISKWHPHLAQAGMTVDLLMAYGTERNPLHPVKLHGRPCRAIVKIVSKKDRSKGMSDVEIVIDGKWWNAADEGDRIALLDHELTHIQTNGGEVDDSGHLRLSMRMHDIEVGWFNDCVERHGSKSLEAKDFSRLVFQLKQTWLPFMKRDGGAPENIDPAIDSFKLEPKKSTKRRKRKDEE